MLPEVIPGACAKPNLSFIGLSRWEPFSRVKSLVDYQNHEEYESAKDRSKPLSRTGD